MGSSKSPKAASPVSSSAAPAAAAKQSKTYLYRAFGKSTLAPVVTLNIEGPGGIVPNLYALVDSGADKSLFPSALMQPLGIGDAECSDILSNTANGQTNYRAWSGGAIKWNGGRLKTSLLGVDLNLNAWFTANCPVILLGREDFFSHFQVTFTEPKKQFRLEVY